MFVVYFCLIKSNTVINFINVKTNKKIRTGPIEKKYECFSNRIHGIKTKSSTSKTTNIIAITKKFISKRILPDPNN